MEAENNEAPALPVNGVDGEEVNPRTAEMTLAAAMNYSDCPVCFNTLLPPIYQCYNGHIICFNCIEKIDICVECRIKIHRSQKIRNIALEKVMNNLYVECSNKDDGCPMKITVEWLRNHLDVCPYTPLKFCSNILGRNDCNHQVNDLSAIPHLEGSHSITKVNNDTFRMCLNVDKIPFGENNFFFEPLLVTSMEIPVLIRSVVSTDGYFTFTGLMFKNDKEEMHNIRLKFRIESEAKKVSFEWSGYVQSYRSFKEINIINSFRIPVDSLIEFWGPNFDTEKVMAISINVSLWTKTAASQEDKIQEEVHLFEQSIRNNAEQNLPHLFGIQSQGSRLTTTLSPLSQDEFQF